MDCYQSQGSTDSVLLPVTRFHRQWTVASRKVPQTMDRCQLQGSTDNGLSLGADGWHVVQSSSSVQHQRRDARADGESCNAHPSTPWQFLADAGRVTRQNGSGQSGTDKMVLDKLVLDKLVRTK